MNTGCACACVYLDAGIYGTDEKDVGEYDEDADVNSQHDRRAARKTQKEGDSDVFQPLNETDVRSEPTAGRNLEERAVLHRQRAKAFEANRIFAFKHVNG